MQESIRRAEELLEKAEVVTLAVNGEDGFPRSYVMTKLPGESIRVFPFLAKEGSEKIRALEQDPRACVSYFAPGGSVSLTGSVQLIRETGRPAGTVGPRAGPDLPGWPGERRAGTDPV